MVTGQIDTCIRDRNLYYIEKPNKPLTTTTGDLRSDGELAAIFGKKGLGKLGFEVPKSNLTALQAVMLNRVKEELMI